MYPVHIDREDSVQYEPGAVTRYFSTGKSPCSYHRVLYYKLLIDYLWVIYISCVICLQSFYVNMNLTPFLTFLASFEDNEE
jgi:hypothetical protein